MTHRRVPEFRTLGDGGAGSPILESAGLTKGGLAAYPHIFPPIGSIEFLKSFTIPYGPAGFNAFFVTNIVPATLGYIGYVKELVISNTDGSWLGFGANLLVGGGAVKDYTIIEQNIGTPGIRAKANIRIPPNTSFDIRYGGGIGVQANQLITLQFWGWQYKSEEEK